MDATWIATSLLTRENKENSTDNEVFLDTKPLFLDTLNAGVYRVGQRIMRRLPGRGGGGGACLLPSLLLCDWTIDYLVRTCVEFHFLVSSDSTSSRHNVWAPEVRSLGVACAAGSGVFAVFSSKFKTQTHRHPQLKTLFLFRWYLTSIS